MSKTVLQRFTRMAMLLAVLLLPLSLHAQNMTLQLKDVTVQEAVTRLQSQGNYTIVVNSEVVDLQKRITVSAKDQPLDKVLAQIFAGQNVEFVINGNSVSVNRKSAQPASQETSFHGFVTDRNGEPLIGASVFEKKSGKYALTDEKGAFFMDGIRFPATFTVSYLGFDDQEVTLTGRERQPYTIVMTSENTVLDELVVVGYGTQKRVNLTGAVSVIDGTTLNQRPVTNTAMALQGADPSIVLTNGNGSIEANEYSLSVRGKVSLNSGSPLVLVDGVEGSLSLVNPNDIESISVLKDASACAIYGAKASAGVILVNTKSGDGEEGKASVNYNGRFSLTSNTTSTNFMTTAYDYVMMTNTFNQALQGNPAWTFSDEQIQMMYDRRADATENPARPWVLPDATGTNTYLYLGNFDWYGYLYRRVRPQTEHNVSISGGSEKISYYASARYLYQKGMFNVADDTYHDFSTRAKVSAKVKITTGE